MNPYAEILEPSLTSESSGFLDFLELTKPRITSLILMSTMLGFYMASPSPFPFLLLLHTLIGTLLVASGAAALNQYCEREADGKMLRTRMRPLPAGKMRPWKALWFGIVLSVIGIGYLAWMTNYLTGLLSAITLISYIFMYTPLKSRTPHCTFVGAFPGAIPILIGWCAVQGQLPVESWVLYLLLFLWQFPHFLAIAWLYQDDYARGGIAMLPVVEPDGKSTARQIIAYSIMLLPLSLIPTLLGMTGQIYLIGAFLLGIWFLYASFITARAKNKIQARRLLQVTVVYLPLVYILMMIDRTTP